MSVSSETSKEDLYKLFSNLDNIKRKITEEKSAEAEAFIKVLDEVLKLRAEVEKLKAKQTNHE